MKRVNLIPAARIDAKRRRDHARRCAVGCGVYSVIALLAAIACRAAWGGGRTDAEQRFAGAQNVIEHTQRTLAIARGDLAAAKVTLAVNQQLAGQPDWSLLLSLLAGQNRDSIVLRSCAINTRAETSAATVTPVIQTISSSGKTTKPAAVVVPPRVAMLTVAGTGESQLAVTEFVVRLEKTELFQRVTVMDTSRDMLAGADAISFRLECVLNKGDR